MAKNEYVQIDRRTLGPINTTCDSNCYTNCYIITCPHTGDSVLIDAPAEAPEILKQLKGTNPRYILITHGHTDHVGALSELKSKLRIPVGAHRLDADGLSERPDFLLHDGEEISFGNIRLKVLHTPGHTPGSVCFLIGKHLISGDTIFPGGPGKTGSPGDLNQIIKSITSKVFVLPDDTEIYPGHGDPTIVRKEKTELAIFSSRPHDPDLFGDVLWLSS
ncbi:MAG TPA: MBL fold metallo-hydrolase [Syntrophorhabdales bacterium]|nr:MBL fold metallo-hydrolase [Syntrophorhabdales bacterium]